MLFVIYVGATFRLCLGLRGSARTFMSASMPAAQFLALIRASSLIRCPHVRSTQEANQPFIGSYVQKSVQQLWTLVGDAQKCFAGGHIVIEGKLGNLREHCNGLLCPRLPMAALSTLTRCLRSLLAALSELFVRFLTG